MTTKITPSRTGTASSSRRTTNVSIARRAARRLHRAPAGPALLVEPGLPEPQVVLDGVHGEPLDGGARDHDLLRVVDGNPHHVLGQDVLDLGVELLALGLVQALARL